MYTLDVRAAIVDGSADGKMTISTDVGIGIALFCFLVLLIGFFVVSRSRPVTPPPRTYADRQITQSYERWQNNMLGRGARLVQPLHTHHPQTSEQYLPLYTCRPSSTLSGTTSVDGDQHKSPEYTELPSLPSPAYFSSDRAESSI